MSESVPFSATAEEEAMAYWNRIQPVDGDASYKGDFAAWAFDQARRIRALKSNDIDIENVAEEIESLGKGEVSKLESLLTPVLLHLLKWDYQAVRRGASWETSVAKGGRQIARHLRDNPSLKPILTQAVIDAYADARYDASQETGMAMKYFPQTNPYDWDAIMHRELRYADPE